MGLTTIISTSTTISTFTMTASGTVTTKSLADATSSTVQSTHSTSSDNGRLSTGAVTGIVVGIAVVVVLLAVAVLVHLILKRRKQRRRRDPVIWMPVLNKRFTNLTSAASSKGTKSEAGTLDRERSVREWRYGPKITHYV